MPTYIHELPGWPAFSWDHERLEPVLGAVRHQQGRLLGRAEALGFAGRTAATLDALTLDALTTSEIEGERLPEEEVRSSVARRLGLDAGGLPVPGARVEGVVAMLLDATQHYAQPLTEERLGRWQAALFPTGRSGLRRVRTGAWRQDMRGPMQVVSGPPDRETVHFEAPAAGRLPAEMAQFLAWFNGPAPLDAVVKAGLAHLWFVTVHPFADGNGRVARAIADLQLARADGTAQRFYSMSAQIQRERGAYYRLLEQTQRGGLDVTAWLEWFLECLQRALDATEAQLVLVLRKAQFWEVHGQHALNGRQRQLLGRLLDGFAGKLTSGKWAGLAKCSQDTATRDLHGLVALGLLVKEAAGGRSTSYRLAGEAA